MPTSVTLVIDGEVFHIGLDRDAALDIVQAIASRNPLVGKTNSYFQTLMYEAWNRSKSR